MITNNKQQGVTAIGMMLILTIIAFFAYLAIRMAPIYIEGFKVKSAVNSMVEDGKASEMSLQEIRNSLMKKLDIDDVDNVRREDVSINKQVNLTSISVEYEAVAPMTDNIDVVVYFSYEAEG